MSATIIEIKYLTTLGERISNRSAFGMYYKKCESFVRMYRGESLTVMGKQFVISYVDYNEKKDTFTYTARAGMISASDRKTINPDFEAEGYAWFGI